MVKKKQKKSKSNKGKGSGQQGASQQQDASSSSLPNDTTTTPSASNNNKNDDSTTNANYDQDAYPIHEDLDQLLWLKECEHRRDAHGEPWLQLEYKDPGGSELLGLLQCWLEESVATPAVLQLLYQIWQQTVLSTLLSSSAVWKQPTVTAADQRLQKESLKLARYKVHFCVHHVMGSLLCSDLPQWKRRRPDVFDVLLQTLQLLPRLAESCPHSKTDLRATLVHFETKEFLASVACESWDLLYDVGLPVPGLVEEFVPALRKCAMLDILDKDWNMLGGWNDILKGLEIKCCSSSGATSSSNGQDDTVEDTTDNASTVPQRRIATMIPRLPCDTVLHDLSVQLRNARNSLQCKFFSVRFLRYTVDQAPQRWRYFPKCSAPACAHLETAERPHTLRCQQCWYFHYCSPTCQDYCNDILGLHPKFCRDTPANKAAQCRQETARYLKWPDAEVEPEEDSNKETAMPKITCNACGLQSTTPLPGSSSEKKSDDDNDKSKDDKAPEVTDDEDDAKKSSNKEAPDSSSSDSSSKVTMKRCSQCQQVYYCCRQCQEWDWRLGGHKDVCQRPKEGDDEDEAEGLKANGQHEGATVGLDDQVKELN